MALRLFGMIGGLSAGLTLAQAGWTVLAAPAFVACLFVAVLLGELSQPRPDRDSRAIALIEVRRIRDYLPRPAAWGVAMIAAAVVGGLAVIVVLGFTGRPQLPSGHVDLGWYGPFSEYGQWPGRGLAGLMVSSLVTFAVALLLSLVFLWLLVRAPRAGADAAARGRDERWRRRAAATLTAAIGWVLSVPLSAFSFLVSAAAADSDSGGVFLSLVPTTVGAMAFVAAGWYGSILLQTSNRPSVGALAGAAPEPGVKTVELG